MTDYLDPEEARERPGLRLVLTAGVPGPWGEAAKSIFFVEKVDYARVRQIGGEPNEALVAWTGHANAPQAVLDDQPARTGWAEILLLAERMAPSPRLLPSDPHARALVFGLSHEICGEEGLGWCRRLQLLQPLMSLPDVDSNPMLAVGRRLAARYGYSEASVAAANDRIVSLLRLFSERLAAQREAGSDYLVGSELTAVDIYWSTFAAMLRPLPAELCPMPEALRAQYGSLTPEVEAALDPALLAHRDRIYQRHLELPLDF
jgi:glutathione S-transferase